MELAFDENEVRRLLIDLVSIDSVNPDLVPGGAGEEEAAKYIAEFTRSLGWTTRLDCVTPTRPNVVATVGGPVSGEAALTQKHGIILNGHTDVVGVDGMTDPFKPRVDGSLVYGRGSADMKGGLIAGLLAMKAVLNSGVKLKKSILFQGVVDEEYASIGTEDAAKRYDADCAIVMEGGLSPSIAHKGFSWSTVETYGKATHGSRYHEGIDAIAMMGRFIARVDALNAGYLKEEPHPLCGHKSIHVSQVTGGKELSTYPDYCKATFERRTLPKEDPRKIVEEFQAIIGDLKAEDARFEAKVTLDFIRTGYGIEPDHPFVLTFSKAFEEFTGGKPELRGGGGWGDSAILGDKGIPTVIFGPGGHGSHDVVEWVDVKNIIKCAEVIARTIVKVCAE